MSKMVRVGFTTLLLLGLISCGKDRPYLSGHVRRAFDAVLTTCDPYDLGSIQSCVVFSSAFRESLYVYNATAGEMVLGPIGYLPLKIKVGRSTDQLVTVVSENTRFPFMFALDRAQAEYFPIRLFPSSDKKVRSFSEPKPVKLHRPPSHMAAVEVGGKIIAVGTYPKEHRIDFFAINPETGGLDQTIAPVSVDVLGKSPRRVVIAKNKVAVITDEANNSLLVLDLAYALGSLTAGEKPTLNEIDINMPSNQLYLSQRDFGFGMELFAVVFRAVSKEVKLVNITKRKVEGSYSFDSNPVAGYFPDKDSDLCCSDIKNWFSVVTIKGDLHYMAVKADKGNITLEKALTVDLTETSNLALGKLYVTQILGGAIERDPKKESLCKNNRETFFITSYANSRSYAATEPVEVEGHGYSCEGDGTASRFGYVVK
ncbi:MAG TPA: hypothetical protein VEL47_03120 [Myxococcota bacterium]|nr:hypothetical protein [Myxococcota bacterium]